MKNNEWKSSHRVYRIDLGHPIYINNKKKIEKKHNLLGQKVVERSHEFGFIY